MAWVTDKCVRGQKDTTTREHWLCSHEESDHIVPLVSHDVYSTLKPSILSLLKCCFCIKGKVSIFFCSTSPVWFYQRVVNHLILQVLLHSFERK